VAGVSGAPHDATHSPPHAPHYDVVGLVAARHDRKRAREREREQERERAKRELFTACSGEREEEEPAGEIEECQGSGNVDEAAEGASQQRTPPIESSASHHTHTPTRHVDEDAQDSMMTATSGRFEERER